MIRVALMISLYEKYGWKGILSVVIWIPKGLDEVCSCKKIRWMITNNVNKKGNK